MQRVGKKWLCVLLAILVCLLGVTGCGELYDIYQEGSLAGGPSTEAQDPADGGRGEENSQALSGAESGSGAEAGAGERDDAYSADAGERDDAYSADTGERDDVYSADSADAGAQDAAAEAEETGEIQEDGAYYTKDEVALYIHTYQKLPHNYMTKKEAQALGWEGGSLEDYAPGMVIGGDRFGNYEGLLPEKEGRSYTECDIDTQGKKRGAKRIVFSNDGLIYYTEDHYESFTLLYGEA